MSVGKDLHVLTLVGTRADGSEQIFYRWAYATSASELAVDVFFRSLDTTEKIVDGGATFTAWRLACTCDWESVTAQRPAELAGLGFIHLLSNRVDR